MPVRHGIRDNGQAIDVIDVIAPDGRGVRFHASDASLRGFVDRVRLFPGEGEPLVTVFRSLNGTAYEFTIAALHEALTEAPDYVPSALTRAP